MPIEKSIAQNKNKNEAYAKADIVVLSKEPKTDACLELSQKLQIKAAKNQRTAVKAEIN
jgi:hypothetical protein